LPVIGGVMTHDSVASADLGRMIDAEMKRYEGSESIGAARYKRLVRIRDFLRMHGYPRNFSEKCALSLVPFVFQEANYDDIGWSVQHADLGHLATLFDIDARVMNEGRPRSMLSREAFAAYLQESRQIIDEHKR
jgi:hypothetical protein